jgi:carotenoid cleavage dioxygenase-like enzyme
LSEIYVSKHILIYYIPGVVVAAVNRVGEDDDDNSCFLLVLDAKSFTEIARVEFEGIARFPYDFHGVYADDKSLKKK